MAASSPGRAPRILQVALSLNPGGTERLVIQLATRLHAEMPTAIVCLDEPGTWAAEVEAHGIHVTALGRQPGFHPSLGRTIAAAAARHGATVLHAHHYSPFVYSALARVWRPSTAVVFTEHGRLSDTPPSPKRRMANRLLASMPKAVCTVSAELRTHVIAEGFPERLVEVVYNGIDVGPLPEPATRAQVRAQLGAGPEATVIGTVARLDPVKHLGSLLRAAALVRTKSPVMIVIVGDGPERASLEALSQGLGLTDYVRFLGHRNDARTWLAGCDVFVNCSVSEGVSLTILEAMAAGLPIIATRVGGTPEVIDASSGVLVPARDDEALSGAIGLLATDSAARRRMGLAARARVESSFTLDRMVNSYAAIYRR